MDIDSIISCAEAHFWMPALSASERATIAANRNALERAAASASSSPGADETAAECVVPGASSKFSAADIAGLSPRDRRRCLLALGFSGAQLPFLLRAAQECAELAAARRAVQRIRFVDTVNSTPSPKQPLSVSGIASNISWTADEWTPAAAFGPLVLAGHPTLDAVMREAGRAARELARSAPPQRQLAAAAASAPGPRPRPPHHFASGICNQGATCYLNSLLQVLYNLPKLRQAVFSLPLAAPSTPTAAAPSSGFGPAAAADSNGNDKDIAISRSLQRLFVAMELFKEQQARMQLPSRAEPPTTRDLTQSFGWTGNEAFVQHDLHECATLLLERLDTAVDKLLGTAGQSSSNDANGNNKPSAAAAASLGEYLDNDLDDGHAVLDTSTNKEGNDVHKLFVIKVKHYFRALDIDYHRSRFEDARYLWLPVKGCPTIYHSLDSYFMEETLEGDAKMCVEHRSGKRSYHPAKKGVLMEKAPPVILMCLMRSDFDPQTGEPVKVTSRNEYYRSLDLGKYMVAPTDDNRRYNLQAVVVHSGQDAGFGHYYAFARVHVDRDVCEARDDLRQYLHEADELHKQPAAAARPRCWLKLNDDVVDIASDYEVFGNNFGGSRRNFWGGIETMPTSAALLVYVRAGEEGNVLFDGDDSMLPAALREQHAELEQAATRKREQRKESRTQAAVHCVVLNAGPMLYDAPLPVDAAAAATTGTAPTAAAAASDEQKPPRRVDAKAISDKWLFGCPWYSHTPPARFVTSLQHGGKQAKLSKSLVAKVLEAIGAAADAESSSGSSSAVETHLLSYDPSASLDSARCYLGPTTLLDPAGPHSAEPLSAVCAQNTVFVLQQPAWCSEEQSRPGCVLVPTFHRFYDPFREVIVPLAALVSPVVAPPPPVPKETEAAAADETATAAAAAAAVSYTRPRDLALQLLGFVRFKLAEAAAQQQLSRELRSTFELAAVCLADIARAATDEGSGGGDFHVYREETPGSVQPVLPSAAPVVAGATYIWQPFPTFTVPRRFVDRRPDACSDDGAAADAADSSCAAAADGGVVHVEQHARFSTVFAFVNYLRNKVVVKLSPVDFRKGFPVTATFDAAGDTDFGTFVQRCADALKLPAEQVPYLRLARNASSTDVPECPPNAIAWLRSAAWTTLGLTVRGGQRSGHFFYELLPAGTRGCTREEAESRPVLCFEFFDGVRAKPASRHHVALPPYGDFTYADLLRICRECVLQDLDERRKQQQPQQPGAAPVPPEYALLVDALSKPDARIALLDVWNGRIYNMYASSSSDAVLSAPVKNLDVNADYRLEVLPPLGGAAQEGGDAALVTVVHFSNRPSSSDKSQTVTVLHGDPFLHRLEPNESVDRFRERIAERLQMPKDRIDRWFVRFVGAAISPITAATGPDAAPIAVQMQAARDKAAANSGKKQATEPVWIGLEHAPLPGTRAQAAQQRHQERSLQI